MEKEYYIKTDLKYRIEINATGFDMDTDDFTIEVHNGRNVYTFTREDLLYVSDLEAESGEDGIGLAEGWYLTINTSDFVPGMVWMSVQASVPDDDFPTGFRNEVTVAPLCNLKPIEVPTWAEKFLC